MAAPEITSSARATFPSTAITIDTNAIAYPENRGGQPRNSHGVRFRSMRAIAGFTTCWLRLVRCLRALLALFLHRKGSRKLRPFPHNFNNTAARTIFVDGHRQLFVGLFERFFIQIDASQI